MLLRPPRAPPSCPRRPRSGRRAPLARARFGRASAALRPPRAPHSCVPAPGPSRSSLGLSVEPRSHGSLFSRACARPFDAQPATVTWPDGSTLNPPRPPARHAPACRAARAGLPAPARAFDAQPASGGGGWAGSMVNGFGPGRRGLRPEPGFGKALISRGWTRPFDVEARGLERVPPGPGGDAPNGAVRSVTLARGAGGLRSRGGRHGCRAPIRW